MNRRYLTALEGVLGIFLAISAQGCATSNLHPGMNTGREGATSAPDYDPKRAFLSIAQIKPEPPAPKHNPEAWHDPTPETTRRLARAREHYDQQRFTEAVLELEKALRHDPAHPLVHRALARAHRAAGNTERVRVHLLRALESDDDDIMSHYLLGRLAFDDQRFEEAITQYRVALKCTNAQSSTAMTALCQFHLAKALNAAGYLTASIESYRHYESTVATLTDSDRTELELATLVQINHGNAGVPISIAYEKLGQNEQAVNALSSAMQAYPPDAATRERFTRLLARVRRFDEALDQARQLIEEGHPAIELLADIYEQAGRHAELITELAALHTKYTDRVDVLSAYIDALKKHKDIDTAIDVLQSFAANHVDEIAVRWQLFDLYVGNGQIDDAIDVAAQTLRDNPATHFTAQQKVVELAERDIDVSTSLDDPSTAHATDHATAFLLGSLASHTHRMRLAEKLLKQSVARDPSFIPAQVELARVLLEQYRWNAVIELTCNDAPDDNLDSRLERLCGQAYAGLDDHARAAEHLNTAIRLNRTDVEAMVALAEVHVDSGETLRARRQYEAVVSANPLQEQAREALIELYLRDDLNSESSAQLAELKQRFADPHRIARCTARIDLPKEPNPVGWSKFRATLQEAIDQHGPDAATLLEISRSWLAQGLPDEALPPIEESLKIDPADLKSRSQLASLRRARLEYSEAIALRKSLLEIHPNRLRWIDDLWELMLIDHRFDDAYDVAQSQLAREGLANDVRRRFRLVALNALERAKRHDERIALLRTWRDAEPDSDELMAWLIDAYGEAERHDEAIALAEKRFEAAPQERSARTALWRALMRDNRYDAAQQLLLAALETDPDDRAAQARLIDALVIADRHNDALEIIENLTLDAPYELQLGLREQKFRVLQDARRFDEAADVLEDWIRETRNQPPETRRIDIDALQNVYANILITAGKFDEVLSSLTQWVAETDRDNARFSYQVSIWRCYSQRGDEPRGIDALQKAYEIFPLRVGINNDLGYSLADAGQRLDDAERMIRLALMNSPFNGAYVDSYGWLLYKKSDFENALHWLQKAAESIEDSTLGADPVVHDHLGDAHWQLQRTDDAVEHWEKSLELIDQRRKDGLMAPDLERLEQTLKDKLDAIKHSRPPPVAPVVSASKVDRNGKTD